MVKKSNYRFADEIDHDEPYTWNEWDAPIEKEAMMSPEEADIDHPDYR